MKKENFSLIFRTAWQFVKQLGISMADALKKSWLNFKLHKTMQQRIVKFHFQKVNGEIREAFGTLRESLLPATKGETKNYKFCKTFYDTEKQEWRMYKTYNIIDAEL